MKKNVLCLMIPVLLVLASVPFSAFALAGHTVSIISTTNVSCNGGNDGAATAAVSGGTGPFGYEWMPGNITGAAATGLSAGTYTVTVTDSSDMSTATAVATISQPTALSITITPVNATCFGNCNGSASSVITGGAGSYTYSWSNSQTSSTATGLCAGSYTVTVVDMNGCMATASVVITEPPQLNANPSATSTSCNAACDGTATSNPTGGTPPYTYNWAPGNFTSSSISNLCAGTYTVTVADANGCVNAQPVTVASPAPLTAFSSSTAACFSSCSGSVAGSVSGGTPPYAYLWQPGNITSSTMTNVCPGTYTLTVTDAMACVSTATVTVTSNPSMNPVITPPSSTICSGSLVQLQATATGAMAFNWAPPAGLSSSVTASPIASPAATTTYTVTVVDAMGCTETASTTVTIAPNPTVSMSSTFTSCNGSNGTATATPSGTAPFSYAWSTGATTLGITNLPVGMYSISITDAVGCVVTDSIAVQDSCGWVWPGDANEDLVADNNDILAIGLGYGFTGPVRANATISWAGQYAQDWNDTLPSGVNLKYTDCNGDGLIDNNDTLAVSQNYGLTHNYRIMQPVHSLSNPNLYLVTSMDSAGPQTLVNVDIMLGDSAAPVDSIYGIAYTLTFDASLIDTNMSLISYTGSWLGTIGTDLMAFSKYSNSNGYVDAAVVRTDRVNRSGSGKIGTFRIVTTDNLSGIVPLNFDVTNVTAITARMSPLTVNTQGDSVILDMNLVTGMTYSELEKHVALFPNPAEASVSVTIPANTVNELVVTDITGREMMSIIRPSPFITLDVSKLTPGMYLVVMRTSKGNISKKLQVIR